MMFGSKILISSCRSFESGGLGVAILSSLLLAATNLSISSLPTVKNSKLVFIKLMNLKWVSNGTHHHRIKPRFFRYPNYR